MNHYWDVNDKVNLNSSVYWSGGMGGGTGTYGSLEWDYSSKQRTVDYDATIFENDSSRFLWYIEKFEQQTDNLRSFI